ncbi:Nodulation receptor kinase [Linum perenne]
MGMGGSHSWRLRSVDSLILCLLILFVPSAPAQQEGFISINCCGGQGQTDSSSIIWISDEQWYPDKTGCLIATAPENYTGNDRVRYFYIDNSEKRCYSLPTTQDRDYLIRGTFPSGKSVGSLGSTFDVLVGVTPISLVDSSGESQVEAVFRSAEQHIDFCLVHETGDPYISQLELRPIHESRYLDGRYSTVLKLVDRVDLGNTGTPIRFPDDPQDRIWSSPDPERVNLSTIATIKNTITNSTAKVPLKVLETAVTNETRLQFLYTDLDKRDCNYTIFLYFFELDNTVRPGQRVFDIYINDEKQETSFDVWGNGSNYSEVALNVTANGYLNLTLGRVNNKSKYGPILNAYEIMQVYQWIQGTNQRDVRVMEKVKDGLLEQNKGNKKLESWSGDPCQPSSWDGVACHYSNGSTVITKLDISSSRLQGQIPTTTAQLIYLKELNLSNNRFSGSIPEFPGSSMLTSVDLRHNDLSRNLPDSLAMLPQLRALRKFGARRNANAKKLPMSKGAVFSIVTAGEDPLRTINIQMFTLNYIAQATQKYKILIGEGGFGAVYRGTLPDGTEVAVKVRSSTSTQGTKEFENELNLLSAIQHENLVRLLGYCSENDQQILVYPFMSNGSLQDRLYGEAAKRKTLDWPTRLSIALGAARGK